MRMSRIKTQPTAIKTFFRVQMRVNLNGYRVRIHRSIETKTKIHADNNCVVNVTNERNRQN